MRSTRAIQNTMAADKDVLSNMFSSFVSRKTRACSPAPPAPLSPHAMSISPPPPLPLLPHMKQPASRDEHTHNKASAAALMQFAVPTVDVYSSAVQPIPTAPSSFGLQQEVQMPPVLPQITSAPTYRTRPRDEVREREVRTAPSTKTARHSKSRSSHVSSCKEMTSHRRVNTGTNANARMHSPPMQPNSGSKSGSRSHSHSQSHSGSGSIAKNNNQDHTGFISSTLPQDISQSLRETVNPNAKDTNGAERGGAGSSSVHGGRGSTGSVEAIATDSTAIATPFHCDKCSKAFRQRSQLSRHFLRVHERKKPFGCAHCDKCFASAFDRKRHVEVSVLIQLLQICYYCPAVFLTIFFPLNL